MQTNKDPSDKTSQSSSDEETDDVRPISKVISQQRANLILKKLYEDKELNDIIEDPSNYEDQVNLQNEGETIESKQRYL